MTAHWFGDRAVLVSLADPTSRHVVLDAFRRALPDCSVRAGMDAVLIEAPVPDPRLLDAVRAVVVDAADDVVPSRSRTVPIEVRYEGADLAAAADMLGVPVPTLVDAHQAQDWEVAMMGFAPGFGYLVPVGALLLDWAAVQRLATPRTQVPGGSVALAAGMSAVYPHRLPGGWQLIGTTTITLFDLADPVHPTALRPGDRVRFVALA